MKTFYLPDLGEGLPDGEINQWHVKEGDVLKVDDPMVAIETAKAVVEVPSPFAGKVTKFYGKVGDVILTGAPLADFDIEEEESTGSSTVAGEIKEGNDILVEKPLGTAGVKALPAVRALAKKMKVDLAQVTPTGPNQTITFDDVKKASQSGGNSVASASPVADPLYEPLKGVRRTMAGVMAQSHREVVPVTLVDDVDISQWESKDFSVRIIQAIAAACQKEPALNAWYQGQQGARRVFDTVNLGLAMDTEDGLFVPVIENAGGKSAQALREEIDTLKKEVSNRTISPDRLKGASIVLSNFGKFAGRYATPIVVPPAVAIVAVGALREGPSVQNGELTVGQILPLSITFDHRAVTGGESTRFMGEMLASLRKP